MPQTEVRTIQKTSKKWKLLQALSALAAITGIVLVVVGYSSEDSGKLAIGLVMVLGGLIGSVVGRIGAWWFHG